jgi:MoaA/NifB/PqqE/SkfB family radical SAM enzyme
MKLFEMVVGGCKFVKYLTKGGLFNINLEVTKRCNARCDFCDYWKERAPCELEDYVPVVSKLNPLSVGLTGGEPLLRKDLPTLITSLRHNFGFLFISLITNGWLLTYRLGLELWEAGLDELSISLDYLDERHDQGRKMPGLTAHILQVAPQLANAGVNLCFNVVIKKGNYREIPRLISYASKIGVKVSISTYNSWRIDNESHMINKDELKDLRNIISEIKSLKKGLGNITTGEYYLDKIPDFFEKKGIPGCTAGINWVQVTPDGMIKRCSDHPVAVHYTKWRRGFFKPTTCEHCWYSCRGAAQEPWSLPRFFEEAKSALH